MQIISTGEFLSGISVSLASKYISVMKIVVVKKTKPIQCRKMWRWKVLNINESLTVVIRILYGCVWPMHLLKRSFFFLSVNRAEWCNCLEYKWPTLSQWGKMIVHFVCLQHVDGQWALYGIFLFSVQNQCFFLYFTLYMSTSQTHEHPVLVMVLP